jgi:hypothetical protein
LCLIIPIQAGRIVVGDLLQPETPTLSTDQAVYTIKDKKVGLRGSGYSNRTQYHVWLRKPSQEATSYSGIQFTGDPTGQIPPTISVPLSPTDPFGTYLVSISLFASNDTSIAQAHFGVWGLTSAQQQRTQKIEILGGGILPIEGRVKLSIRNPSEQFVYDTTLIADEKGEFRHTWRIPENSLVGPYTVLIDGRGSYDDPARDYASRATFSVIPAVLNVSILREPSHTYQRTDVVSFHLKVQYPDGTPVTTVKDQAKPVDLYIGSLKLISIACTLIDKDNGVWKAELKLPRNATISSGYRLELAANAFDDGSGNTGGKEALVSSSFQVMPASLDVKTSINQTDFQAPFDVIKIHSRVLYPDATTMMNGTVFAKVRSGDWVDNITFVYDSRVEIWKANRSLSIVDLLHIGLWEISIIATDQFGNSGSTKVKISIVPYSFVLLLLVVTFAGSLIYIFLKRFFKFITLRLRRFRSWLSLRREFSLT